MQLATESMYADEKSDNPNRGREVVIKPGKYRHFKGNLYEVESIARHSETQEEYVVYRALYGEGGLWVRPLQMFAETIERDGKIQRRFAPVID